MYLITRRNVSENIALYFLLYQNIKVARGSVVVKELCYKPKGHGFDPQ
jgi:hypothetical protein